jgi:hypothetical protein
MHGRADSLRGASQAPVLKQTDRRDGGAEKTVQFIQEDRGCDQREEWARMAQTPPNDWCSDVDASTTRNQSCITRRIPLQCLGSTKSITGKEEPRFNEAHLREWIREWYAGQGCVHVTFQTLRNGFLSTSTLRRAPLVEPMVAVQLDSMDSASPFVERMVASQLVTSCIAHLQTARLVTSASQVSFVRHCEPCPRRVPSALLRLNRRCTWVARSFAAPCYPLLPALLSHQPFLPWV